MLQARGDLAGAADEFQAALDLRPQDFWPNFYQGLCAYQLGRFDDAIDAFRVCIALAPEGTTPWSWWRASSIA